MPIRRPLMDYTPKNKKPTYPKFARTPRPKGFVPVSPVVSTLSIRETEKLPIRVTPGGDTSKKEDNRYSGDNVLGISLLHKSCLQPVFSKQEAIENAKMRR